MSLLIKVMPNFKKFKAYQKDIEEDISPVMLSGLTDAGKVHFAYATQFYSERPIFIVTYNEMQAKKLIRDFGFFTDKVGFFPKREIATYDIIAESKEALYERMDTINRLEKGELEVVVTTIEAVCQKMIRKESLYKNKIFLKTRNSYSLDEVKQNLQYLGYERIDLVEAKGQYSVRGGIVDIGISEKQGVRIEFWGDEVDSIRYFQYSNQRSDHMSGEVLVYPCHEFVLEKPLEEVKKQILKRTFSQKAKEYLKQDMEQIEQGDYTSKVDKYFNCFYKEQETILDYLGKDTILFLDEIGKIKARIENIKKDSQNMVKSLVEKERFVPESIQNSDDFAAFSEKIKHKQTVYLEKQDIGFVDKESMHAKRNGYSFSYREVNFFRSSMDLLFEEVQAAKIAKKTIIILGGSKENSKKISSLLLEKGIPNEYSQDKEKEIAAGDIIVTPGAISAGFECYDFDLLVITGSELFNKPQKKRVVNKAFKEGETIIFADLKVGDFIVHKTNGIGQFIGVNTIKADGVTKDYIKIRYKGDDVLYVPTNNLDNVRKYIGAGETVSPKLNKLGSKEWEKTKAKVKSNLEVIAKQLVELYAKRQKVKGFAFCQDTPWQKEFEDQFPYQETEDQLRCIEEVKKDMEMEKPMDRLLCGDVGYGKTEVAIRAAFKACMDQKQVAYLVPTTILSTQQYDCFKQRMEAFPIRVEVLNRFRTAKEQKEIVKKLELGEIDVIIGTHRILSQDIKFKDLGLLIIDEEHRFGVKAKEKIKELKTNVDVLTMTATPIPRTLHMSIVGVRDMSVIYEPPQNRRPVQTYVLEYDEEVMKEAITKELERNGQVFYLYNKVESIIQKAEQISKLVPEAKVAFAHGKMTGKELEEIMLEFIEKKINVLICTTILESGIDIPNANTIIVENADRLGLAQLYQIRGRVGRADKQAYAYITYKRDKLLSEVAEKRLKAIKEFTEFGSGFKIAMRDLEIRGAGSILGELQHGHMDQVGYDMYCKLLDEAVKDIQGIEIEEEKEIQIDMNLSSYIPDEYIQNSSQKIEIYQNIALCRTEEDILNITDEMLDRYGQMPTEIENLLEIARIKNLCKMTGVIKIAQKKQAVLFYFDQTDFDMNLVDFLVKNYRNRIKFSPAKEPYITYQLEKECDAIKETKEFLKNCKKERKEYASNR